MPKESLRRLGRKSSFEKNQVVSYRPSSSYTTPPTTVADDGSSYDCIVSNSAGSVTSSAAVLTVVDATRVLLRNGPRGGDLGDVKRVEAIAVSQDPVAVDAWAASILGMNPAKLGYLKIGEKRKLGRMDYRALSPVQIKVG